MEHTAASFPVGVGVGVGPKTISESGSHSFFFRVNYTEKAAKIVPENRATDIIFMVFDSRRESGPQKAKQQE
jgi:hypothetical protein